MGTVPVPSGDVGSWVNCLRKDRWRRECGGRFRDEGRGGTQFKIRNYEFNIVVLLACFYCGDNFARLDAGAVEDDRFSGEDTDQEII